MHVQSVLNGYSYKRAYIIHIHMYYIHVHTIIEDSYLFSIVLNCFFFSLFNFAALLI